MHMRKLATSVPDSQTPVGWGLGVALVVGSKELELLLK